MVLLGFLVSIRFKYEVRDFFSKFSQKLVNFSIILVLICNLIASFKSQTRLKVMDIIFQLWSTAQGWLHSRVCICCSVSCPKKKQFNVYFNQVINTLLFVTVAFFLKSHVTDPASLSHPTASIIGIVHQLLRTPWGIVDIFCEGRGWGAPQGHHQCS